MASYDVPPGFGPELARGRPLSPRMRQLSSAVSVVIIAVLVPGAWMRAPNLRAYPVLWIFLLAMFVVIALLLTSLVSSGRPVDISAGQGWFRHGATFVRTDNLVRLSVVDRGTAPTNVHATYLSMADHEGRRLDVPGSSIVDQPEVMALVRSGVRISREHGLEVDRYTLIADPRGERQWIRVPGWSRR